MQIDKIRGPLMHGHKLTDIAGLEAGIGDIVNGQLPDTILNDTSTRILSGSVTWLTGLTYGIQNLKYQILGTPYTVPDQEITLDNADGVNPRLDCIYGNVFGDIGKLTGNAAPNPSKPLVNPASQIELTLAYIPTGATEPGTDPDGETGTIVTEPIYNENTEWITSKVEDTNVNIDFNGATAPSSGAKCIVIGMNTPGAVGVWARGALSFTEGNQVKKLMTLAAPVNANFTIDFTDGYFTDHMTDVIAGLIRSLVYYRAKNKNVLTGYLTNTGTGTRYNVTCSGFTNEAFAVAELGFSVQVPNVITLVNAQFALNGAIPAGNYELTLNGFDRYVQLFTTTLTAVVTFIPQLTAATFTRAGGVIDAKGGNISFDLRTDKAFLTNSGLLIQLYSGASAVGSKALLPAVNMYGFNGSVINVWQRVTIPIADFNPSTTVIDKVIIRPINEYPNDILLGIDLVKLQTGSQTQGNGDITLAGDVTGSGNSVIPTILSDSVVSPDKLNAAFKGIVPIAALDVDFSLGQIFTKTLAAETTLTFSNLHIGVKDLEITGDFLLHLPAWVKIIDGTYNGTVENLIQIMVTNAGNGTEKGWATISQEAV